MSKCYKIINRFSEDIDLNYDYYGDVPSVSKRKEIHNCINKAINECGLIYTNQNQVWYKKKFVRYRVNYEKIYDGVSYIKPEVQVETAFFLDSNPIIKMKVQSIIGEYLKTNELIGLMNEYNLGEFEVNVQSIERTLVDKTIAICDYYIDDRIREHSRHIYDLYMIVNKIDLNDDIIKLFKEVINKRNIKKIGRQFNQSKFIYDQLEEIVDKKIYKVDYETITNNMCIKKVDYDIAITGLDKIIKVLKQNNI